MDKIVSEEKDHIHNKYTFEERKKEIENQENENKNSNFIDLKTVESLISK